MVDPSTSLAFSVYGNKGVYALLLGSGVSRAAGVPTGWEVGLDLIRMMAHVMGEDPEPEADAWYRGKFGREADYSELLDSLTRSSAERSQLLRSYFEPNEEEQEQRLKAPTAAHRAIAELIRGGYVRVVVTTNFDRLLEQALQDLGIGANVISTPEAAEGCMPLAHARCTIVKINGDYLDPQLKNTMEELSSYAEPMNALLDRIFDEFGLIVCGWSGDYDTALRAALERCQSHRFGAYWCVFGGKPSDRGQRLIDYRRAAAIQIESADKLFADLSERVRALEGFGEAQHPLSAKLAVERLKRHLTNRNLIGMRDLLMGEAERAFSVLHRVNQSDCSPAAAGDEIARRLSYYEHHVDTLLQLQVTGAYYSSEDTDTLLLESFKRIFQVKESRGGDRLWLDLQRYPALVLMYGIGLASIASGDYRLLAGLFTLKVREGAGRELEAVAAILHNEAIIGRDQQKALPGRENGPTPLCNRLENLLREPLREFLPDDSEFRETFDWFEYLLALVYVDVTRASDALQPSREGKKVEARGPIGCFGWRERNRDRGLFAETELRKGEFIPEKVTKVLQAGLFGGTGPTGEERFRAVKSAFDRFCPPATWSWR